MNVSELDRSISDLNRSYSALNTSQSDDLARTILSDAISQRDRAEKEARELRQKLNDQGKETQKALGLLQQEKEFSAQRLSHATSAQQVCDVPP